MKISTPQISQYARYEAAFTLPNQSGNPFDPAENDVDVAFVAPNHSVVVTPAFWDGDTWRVRFTPTQEGAYSWTVSRNGTAIQPLVDGEARFQCTASTNPGFIHRNPSALQRFVFDNGTSYYPYGTDLAWLDGSATAYPSHLARMSESHMNWARIWMTAWDNKALDWSGDAKQTPPFGSYSMDAARTWDSIFDSAAHDGIYVQMTLQHHGQYTEHTDPNWSGNPYNVANGGFLQHPDDFFTDPHAIALTKAKYRYIVARWGYSPHLFAFELFNEVQNITEASSHFGDVVAWHKTMAAYIRSIDPYHHLVTASNSVPGDALSSIGLDVDQQHIYAADPATVFGSLPVSAAEATYFVGEWGPDPESRWRLREGLWAGIMSPTAGAAQYWYWDRLDSEGLWPVFESAGRFISEGNVAEIGTARQIKAQTYTSGPLTDLSFTPSLGWEKDKTYDLVPNRDGSVTGIGGVSNFLQGTYHPEMQAAPISIHFDSSAPCQLSVHFAQVSGGGAHPVLSLVGATAKPTEINYISAPNNHNVTDVLTVDVPAGPQTVTLANIGPDWVTIGYIQVTNFASPIEVASRGDDHSAVFFTTVRESSKSPVIVNGHIRLSGFVPGRYKIRLWQIDDAAWLPDRIESTTDGNIRIALPQINCIAGVVTKI